MKKMRLLGSLVLFVVAGCVTSRITATMPVKSPSPVALDRPRPKPIVTGIPISAPTLKPDDIILKQCIVPAPETQLTDVAVGTILLEDNNSAYLLDLQNSIEHRLPFKTDDISSGGTAVSPNGNYLAYVQDIYDSTKQLVNQRIWVIDAAGKILITRTVHREILSNQWHWLDNERLEFQSSKVTTKDGTVVFYNPFKNDWRYLSNRLPGFYDTFDVEPVMWLVDYDTTLNFVAYYGHVETGDLGIIIRNIGAERNIWQYPGTPSGFPKWSTFRDEIVVLVQNQLFRIDKSGKVNPAPRLRNDQNILDYAVSPNGQLIAFWVGLNGQGGKADLMVYDIEMKQLVDYCIGSDSAYVGDLKKWSVDSKQFIADVYRKNSGNLIERTLLIDTRNNAAYELSKGQSPLEWMNSLP